MLLSRVRRVRPWRRAVATIMRSNGSACGNGTWIESIATWASIGMIAKVSAIRCSPRNSRPKRVIRPFLAIWTSSIKVIAEIAISPLPASRISWAACLPSRSSPLQQPDYRMRIEQEPHKEPFHSSSEVVGWSMSSADHRISSLSIPKRDSPRGSGSVCADASARTSRSPWGEWTITGSPANAARCIRGKSCRNLLTVVCIRAIWQKGRRLSSAVVQLLHFSPAPASRLP